MKKYISLLRGINVSGQKKINMNDLKSLYSSLNLFSVRTYIQSGNVLFCSNQDDELILKHSIEREIEKEYKFKVPTIVLNAIKLKRILSNNPFHGNDIDFKKLYVIFLSLKPASSQVKLLHETELNEVSFLLDKDIIYLYCPEGYGRTRFNNNFFEKKLKVDATTRNWNTVTKLGNMLKEISCIK